MHARTQHFLDVQDLEQTVPGPSKASGHSFTMGARTFGLVAPGSEDVPGGRPRVKGQRTSLPAPSQGGLRAIASGNCFFRPLSPPSPNSLFCLISTFFLTVRPSLALLRPQAPGTMTRQGRPCAPRVRPSRCRAARVRR
jgi:hypothetical protein